MVTFGKWRMGHWHDRSGHYVRLDSADKTWHYQALQELRRHKDGMWAIRRLLAQGGLDNVFRLWDVEVLEILADRLRSGEICLFEFRRKTLHELCDAAFETSIGKELLRELQQFGRDEPPVIWGKAEYRSKYDPETHRILLHQHFMKDDGNEPSDNEWIQAIVFELGNALNDARFRKTLDAAVADPPSRDEFTATVAEQEFETRTRIVKAYNDGQFCRPVGTTDCISIFDLSVRTFTNYLQDPQVRQHRNELAWVWDRYCRLRFEQKQTQKAKLKEQEKEKQKEKPEPG